MTDTIDTLNDEINGGRGIASRVLKKIKRLKKEKLPGNDKLMQQVKAKLAETSNKINNMSLRNVLNEKASEISNVSSEAVNYVSENSDFYLVLFAVNFVLRLLLVYFSSQFKGHKYYIDQYKKHVKESFGITIIITVIFLYMYSFAKKVLRDENNQDCIQFTIFTLILFSIFMYDYVNIVLMLVNTKYFSKDNKNKGYLSGIMSAIIAGIFVLYYFTIVLSKGFPLNIFDFKKHKYSWYLGSGFLLLLFILSFIGFLIVNINKIDSNESNPLKAIWGSITNTEENRLNNNQKKTNDRKEFFIDMFKKYYMIFILISCILLVVLELNRIEFYSFVESIYPCPPTQTAQAQTAQT